MCVCVCFRVGDHTYTVSRRALEEQNHLLVDDIPIINHPDLRTTTIQVVSNLHNLNGTFVIEQDINWTTYIHILPNHSTKQQVEHNRREAARFIAEETLIPSRTGDRTPYCVFTCNAYIYICTCIVFINYEMFPVFNSHNCNQHALPAPDG